jgi:hypothetical protein
VSELDGDCLEPDGDGRRGRATVFGRSIGEFG